MCERSASPYHLLLDTGASSTTNVKMKKLYIIAGLLIIGLLAQSGLAKTKTRNERIPRQAYLPPRVPSGPTITEEYITIHEEGPDGQQQFRESNYGDGKYQIFEIHSHYDQPSGTPGAGHTSFNAPGYLPPQQEIRVEHVHQTQSAQGLGGINHHVSPVSAPAPIAPAVSFQHNFPKSQSESISSSGSAAGYAAPVQEEIIRVEHIHVSQLQNSEQQTVFSGPDYLPPLQDQHHAQHQQHSHSHHHESSQFKAPDYLPPHDHHTQNPPISIQSVHHHQHQQQLDSFEHHQQGDSFKGPDYLPPHTEHQNNQPQVQFTAQQNSQFKGPDYLPPHQEHQRVTQQQHIEQHQTATHSNQFKGPDYLPPHQVQQSHHHDAQHQVHQQTSYKGPDYLPPHQQQSHHQETHQHEQHHQTAYKGPDYLPPHQTQQNHQHIQQEVQSHQSHTSYKGPDYLPPHQGQVQNQQAAFKGPDYLPPHQQQHSHARELHQQVQHQSTSYRGPDYLPPHQQQHNNHYVHQAANAFRAPDYLPPHQVEHSNHQETLHQTHASHLPSYQTVGSPQPGSLPLGYEPQIPAVPVPPHSLPSQPAFQHPIPQPTPQHQAPSNLPQGYDFEKPENAEQAIAELHTLPEEPLPQQEVVVQSQIQVAQGHQQADIIYGSQQSGVNYQVNGYLPPQQPANTYQVQQANVQTVTSSVGVQQSLQQYQRGLQQQAPQTFTPTPAAPVAQAPASNYLPPATPVQAQQYNSNLHSLSSYMSSVEPFQRYASAPRQPFREYGPPPPSPAAPNNGPITQQQQQQHQLQPLPVAPMYNEQTSRPPYYAPAMSYATNAVANSHAVHHTASQHQHVSFNEQTRQSLQQFMPKDIRRPSPAAAPQPAAVHSAPAVPVHQPISSKIRTVQILNTAAVKTLKVLETSDHAGVKTIKILGPSNTQPTGEHQIVKVVTQNAPNAHEHVQTVKIFNDHEEVPSHGGAGSNAYLPPNVRVARQTPKKLQLLSNEKYRRPFTGRRRYRF